MTLIAERPGATSTSTAADLEPSAPEESGADRAGGPKLGSIWPLYVLCIGFPIWWILGLSATIAMALAIPMAVQLWRHRKVVAPGGFGWWLMFLVWVLLGAFVLFADAPYAVPGGGWSRALVFAYRIGWYLTCTVVLLWLANSSRRTITFNRVCNIIGYLFVITVAGGLLGTFFPDLELRSLVEVLLPPGLRNNGFIQSIVHPNIAEVQEVLGRPESRPTAPFSFANSWGSNLSITLPFFLVGWLRHGRRWQQIVSVPVLVLGLIPVVYSLNRGLWISLLVGLVFFVVLQVSRGKLIALFVSILGLGLAALMFVASPLGELVNERLENQHSNDRRSQLLTQTVTSAATGSPVLGFGSTRDVRGSFASIAGASTPDCPACGVPPLGTQGHLWLVIFAQGLVGAAFFLIFFLVSFFRSWRCRTTPEVVATCLLLFFAVQLFVYDTLGMPLFLIMVAIALAWREQARAVDSENYLVRVTTLRAYYDVVVGSWKAIVAMMLVGAVVGLTLAFTAPRQFTSREKVMLAPSPSFLVTGLASDQSPQETTIDTEAALVLSEGNLRRIRDTPYTTSELRDRIVVTAEPNTSVLVIQFRDSSPARAQQLVEEISTSYLDVRRQYLLQRRSQVLADLRNRFNELAVIGVATPGAESGSRGRVGAELNSVDQAISNIILTPTTAGEKLLVEPAVEVDKDYSKYGGSGAAVGLLICLAVVAVRIGRRPRIPEGFIDSRISEDKK